MGLYCLFWHWKHTAMLRQQLSSHSAAGCLLAGPSLQCGLRASWDSGHGKAVVKNPASGPGGDCGQEMDEVNCFRMPQAWDIQMCVLSGFSVVYHSSWRSHGLGRWSPLLKDLQPGRAAFEVLHRA